MTSFKLTAASVAAAVFAISGSIALAAHAAPFGSGGYACRAWNPTKMSPSVTQCITWTREGEARMRAANCDPSMKTDGAMRAQCTALMDAPQAPAVAG